MAQPLTAPEGSDIDVLLQKEGLQAQDLPLYTPMESLPIQEQLKYATQCGDLQLVNSVISRIYGRQKIHYAAVHSDLLTLKQLLLDEGLDINIRDNFGSTPLMLAASNGGVEAVNILLEAGADVLLRDKREMNAYDWAAYEGYDEVLAILQPLTPVEERHVQPIPPDEE